MGCVGLERAQLAEAACPLQPECGRMPPACTIGNGRLRVWLWLGMLDVRKVPAIYRPTATWSRF